MKPAYIQPATPMVEGFVYGSDRGPGDPEAAIRRLGGKAIPVGNGVTTRFPWIRTAPIILAPGARQYIQRVGFQPGFANDCGRNVYVHEVRIMQILTALPWVTSQTDLRIRMGTSAQQIVEPMFPWQGLQTEMDRYLLGDIAHFAWTLPAPYFLSRSHPFMIDILRNAALDVLRTVDDAMYVSLHGVGFHDGEPIDLIKTVHGTGGTTLDPFTIPFDDDRDMPLRDAWIHRIGFAAGMMNGGNVGATYIRPRPPEGLKWHNDEFFRINSLSDQQGIRIDWTGGLEFNNPIMIHRPRVPYVLETGNTFWMELWNANPANTYSLDVTLIGTQDKPEEKA